MSSLPAPNRTLTPMRLAVPRRPRSTFITTLLLWLAFYASFTLFRPALLDDADSVHVEVAREMLVRHDPVTLYANGIRYLEKAPLLYWLMALSMRLAGLFGVHRPELLVAAARLPLALSVLGLALLADSLARHIFRSGRAGLYASLILLSSFGIFIFSRITIPDALVCLWITLSLHAFWLTEELDGSVRRPPEQTAAALGRACWLFAVSCALNVLTKGLIGIVFPIGIVLIYLALTRGLRSSAHRLRQLHPGSSLLLFLVIAAPWHIAAGLANPTQGHPAPFVFVRDPSSVLRWGHWHVPLPLDGNVRGWWWFYFMNEHLLRYLNLRVPRDYDTVPLALFWGLCFIWMMPWSAFALKAAGWALPLTSERWRRQFGRHDLPLARRGRLLLVVAAAFVLLFFSLSTRQEYYVLPALPFAVVLIAGWLAYRPLRSSAAGVHHRAGRRISAVLAILGAAAAAACLLLILHIRKPVPGTDLSQLLQQNPGEYALSFGHFLDLNAEAMGMFRRPLAITAISLGLGWPAAWFLRVRRKAHYSTLVLALSTFGFLLASHLGLQTFTPVLSSAQMATALRPLLRPRDLVVIHGEYESGSTLGFYLKRDDIHILEGRSSNLWYGSFFPDAPPIFETPASLAVRWNGPQRVCMWQSLTDPPNQLPPLPGPVHILVRSGGKEIVCNRLPALF